MPSDPDQRRLAVRLKHHMRLQLWRGRPDYMLEQLFPKARHEAAKAVWRLLFAAGTVVNDGVGFRFVSKGRLEPVDAASRKANFDAVVAAVAARACGLEESAARCRTLFRRVRTLYGVHSVAVSGARAVLVPVRMGMEDDGPFIDEAFAVLVTSEGLLAASVPGDALNQRFEGDGLVISIEPDSCIPDPGMQKMLDDAPLSPFTSRPSDIATRAARLARQSILPVARARKECSRFIGEELSPDAWKSFSASLRQVSPLAMMFRRVLFGALDRDARRAAMRNPVSDTRLYGWFCRGESIRRLQASAVFPILTQRLPQVEKAIDAGEELVPALSRASGLPVPAVRKLRGLTWQKLGPHFRILVEGQPGDDLTSLLAQIAPERIPVTRAEWHAASEAAESLGMAFGWPSPGSLASAASRDWGAFEKLVRNGFIHSVEDTAAAMTTALRGVWTESGSPDVAVSRLVAAAVSGSDGGLKRIVAFNDRWHREAGRRAASLKVLRRRLYREELISWKPLTAPGAFSSGNGSLEWLCDEDALAEEGGEMRHCVGTYSWACSDGRSHIAAVRAGDGGRSTVEFAVDGESLETVQHKAIGNSDPTSGCEAVVRDFVAAVRAGLPTERQPGTRRIGPPEPPCMHREVLGVNVTDLEAAEILAIYADCLPGHERDVSLASWRRKLAAAEMAGTSWRRGGTAAV